MYEYVAVVARTVGDSESRVTIDVAHGLDTCRKCDTWFVK